MASWLVVAGMSAYLLWRLHGIGWSEIWAAHPTSPIFYVLVVAGYFVLPFADALIYRGVWNVRFRASLPVFLRKRIYNSALVGYSGELYLLMWARGRVRLPGSEIAHAIKDTNILSAVASGLVAAALVVYVFNDDALGALMTDELIYAAIATVAAAALVPIALMFGGRFMLFSARTACAVLTVHLIRFLVTQALQLGQWSSALPDADWAILTGLLAMQTIIGRLPFLPNRELLFVGVAIASADDLALSSAALASLLITAGAIQQALHLAVFALTSVPRRAPTRREPA